MDTRTKAVVFEQPKQLSVRPVHLKAPGQDDCVVEVEWSGISTGTERLLWSGRMPAFPGMGYPLVPGYEAMGRVLVGSPENRIEPGMRVFVPGANCYEDARGLFGGAAARLVTPVSKLVQLDEQTGEEGTLLSLAATAHHVCALLSEGHLPQLIVGHGVLGRLLARIVVALGGEPPTVWETRSSRRQGTFDYNVIDPASDARRDYQSICDVSGDPTLLDTLISHLAPRGVVTLAGFYDAALQFTYPPAFIREARIQVAAEWRPGDLTAVAELVRDARLSLSGLITHRAPVADARNAYREAFENPDCLKMVLDWKDMQ